jgi:hypothetical protein
MSRLEQFIMGLGCVALAACAGANVETRDKVGTRKKVATREELVTDSSCEQAFIACQDSEFELLKDNAHCSPNCTVWDLSCRALLEFAGCDRSSPSRQVDANHVGGWERSGIPLLGGDYSSSIPSEVLREDWLFAEPRRARILNSGFSSVLRALPVTADEKFCLEQLHSQGRSLPLERLLSGEASISEIRYFFKISSVPKLRWPCRRGIVRGIAKAIARLEWERLIAPIVESCRNGLWAQSKCNDLDSPGLADRCKRGCRAAAEAGAAAEAEKAQRAWEAAQKARAEAEEQKARAAAEEQKARAMAAATAAREKKAQERAACIKKCQSMGKDVATCGRICN